MRPRFAVLAVVLALGFPAHSTASGPEIDSPPASSDSTAASAVSIQLQRDSTLTAVRVEPLSDFVRVIHADGTEEYLPNHRIRWIRDAKGRDKTSLVLDRGKSFGEVPITVRYAATRASRTLRGRPLPIKKTFPVIQIGVFARLDREGDQTTGLPPTERANRFSEHPASLVVDLGGMKNVSQRWAIGASFCYAGDEDFERVGTKVRFRRWLGSDVAIDMAPGILFSGPEAGGEYLPGVVGELGVSFGDWMSVTGQVETAGRKYSYGYLQPTPYGYSWSTRETSHTEVSWYLGGKFGGEAAMVAFFGSLLLGMILTTGDVHAGL
jgi:hypothetical protein